MSGGALVVPLAQVRGAAPTSPRGAPAPRLQGCPLLGLWKKVLGRSLRLL